MICFMFTTNLLDGEPVRVVDTKLLNLVAIIFVLYTNATKVNCDQCAHKLAHEHMKNLLRQLQTIINSVLS
nr:hypothetical protein [Buzura suppressaria nucleopolyhedrovirus]